MEPNNQCHTCGAPVYVKPSRSHFKRVFCNQNCLSDEKVRWIGFITANYQTKQVKHLAEYIGVPPATLRTWIFYINQWLEGYCRISFKLGAPYQGGRKKQVYKPKVNPNQLVPKAKEWKDSRSTYGKPEKKPAKQFETKVVPIDAAEYRWIKENGKTWKQVKINKKSA